MDALLFTLLAAIAVVIVSVLTFGRGQNLLERWAYDNGYRILEARHQWLWHGPFFWQSSEGNLVYRIRVLVRRGVELRGWARCGS